MALKHVPTITVVGGGSAGWITANVLIRRFGRDPNNPVKIVLVESERLGILGVGEATIPSIRKLLQGLGISEAAFMRRCNATFKHGILYKDWLHDGASPEWNTYFHPFDYTNVTSFNAANWWLRNRASDPIAHYAADISAQYAVAMAGRAPRLVDMAPFEGSLGYAYHLDAERLAQALGEIGRERGVEHIVDDVVDAELSPNGSLASIRLKERGTICSDFFVDCTGFAALLIERHLKTGFNDLGKVLFCDRAVAMRVPTIEQGVSRPYTTSTAMDAGWMWEIDLTTRRGAGYVYSSTYCSPEEAEAGLRTRLGSYADGIEARHLRMRVGYAKRFWNQNVVAIGLSGGFVEPLESTGLHLIEVGATQLADSMQFILGTPYFDEDAGPGRVENANTVYRSRLQGLTDVYNQRLTALYDEIIDFVKAYYTFSRREKTAFWRDNLDPTSWTDSLRSRMAEWSYRPPYAMDFPSRFSLFTEHSWLYIMLGMKWLPVKAGGSAWAFEAPTDGAKLLELVGKNVAGAIRSLPDQLQYLKSVPA